MRRAMMGCLTLTLALSPTPGFAHGELPGAKNAISRGPLSGATTDSTTGAQAAAAIDAATKQRAEPEPDHRGERR